MLHFCNKNKYIPFSSDSYVCAIDQFRRSAADTAVVLECQKGLALSFRLSGLEDWLLQLSGLEDYQRGIHLIHQLGIEPYTDTGLQLFVLQNFENQYLPTDHS